MAEEEVAASPTHHTHKKVPVVDVEEKRRRRRPRFYYMASSDSDHRADTARVLFSTLLLLLLLAGVTALVLYLVYRPSHPRFSVTAVSVYTLGNATAPSAPAPPTVSTSMQFTVVIRNPNDRASVRYDRLAAYASYRGQAITPLLGLPPLFQETDSAVTLSPVLGGAPVPVSPDAAAGLAADAAYGVVPLRLVVLGRVRYKSGPYHGGWRDMAVQCDVLVGVRHGVAGQAPLLRAPDCNVDA